MAQRSKLINLFKKTAVCLSATAVVVEAGMALYTEYSPDIYRRAYLESCEATVPAIQRPFLQEADKRHTITTVLKDGDILRERPFILTPPMADSLSAACTDASNYPPISLVCNVKTVGQHIPGIVSMRAIGLDCVPTAADEKQTIITSMADTRRTTRFILRMWRTKDHTSRRPNKNRPDEQLLVYRF